MWEELCEPWRACVEEAGEAYRVFSLPIGAVVTDAQGNVLSQWRNRIHERSGPPCSLLDHKLAHAELAPCSPSTTARTICALRPVDHHGTLPLMRRGGPGERRRGAALRRQGALGRVCGHVRDGVLPARWQRSARRAGGASARGGLGGPAGGTLPAPEANRTGGRFLRPYEEVMPEAAGVGQRLHRSGALRATSGERTPVSEVLARVSEELYSAR